MPVQSRSPRQLLLAILGENMVDEPERPVRAGAFIAALGPTGVTGPAVRVALDRLVHTEVLSRERRGREVVFALTPSGTAMLREATDRVRRPHELPLERDGWTSCTFSIPERQRALRHRLRSILSWAGFAPLRDGLWLAPGEVDLSVPLGPLRNQLPEGSILAFHAREVADFPIAAAVREAWDIDAIRAAHHAFIDTWSDPEAVSAPVTALAASTMLVADWLALLRIDPHLPRQYMGEDWPLPISIELYRGLREDLRAESSREFADLRAGRAVTPRERATSPVAAGAEVHGEQQ